MFPVGSLSINLSVGLREESVARSDTGDRNTLVPHARWQEGEELVWGMCGVVLSASGFSDTVCVEKVCDGGESDCIMKEWNKDTTKEAQNLATKISNECENIHLTYGCLIFSKLIL